MENLKRKFLLASRRDVSKATKDLKRVFFIVFIIRLRDFNSLTRLVNQSPFATTERFLCETLYDLIILRAFTFAAKFLRKNFQSIRISRTA